MSAKGPRNLRTQARRSSDGTVALYRALVENVSDYGIFMLDPTGKVMTWNIGAEKIKGYRADEIIGQHFSRFYPMPVIERGWPDHELAVARAEGRFEDEGWRVRKDGSTFWANIVITAIRGEDGVLLGYAKITRDLTERRRQEETLRQSEERFRLLVEGVKDYAIIMLDAGGHIKSWNAGAERINGYTAEEIIGRHFSTFYPPEAIAIDWPTHELRVARLDGRFEDEGWRIRKDGSRFWASVIITSLYDRSGNLRGYGKVTRDLTQRQRMMELQESSRRMTEFVAMLAHELRNPLSAIRNAAEIMALHLEQPAEVEWSREVISRQTAHLSRLVDDLLDVNRITSGRILVRKEPIEIAVVLARAIEAGMPLLQARKHEMRLAVPNVPLVVDGDLTRLSQVFLNLINNAAKYTPEGGRIDVEARAEHGEAVIRVRDNGIGIPPDLLPKVFDIFVQGSRSLDRAEGGLGIGLALVREIVRLHGGTVSASSEPQAGAEFTVRLPRLTDVAVTPRAGPPASRLTSPRRILVVDDNQDSAESLALLLRTLGHHAETAADGPSALDKAAAQRPDVVMLDIGLPGMDGYTVAKSLRALPHMDKVLLIAITGYGQSEDRKRSKEAGFDHHLVKPVDLAALSALLAAP